MESAMNRQRLADADLFLAEAIQSKTYVQVRRRVFRQLLESALYERIIPAEELALPGGVTLFIIPGRDGQGVPVTYNCRGYRRLSFGRIRLKEDSMLRISSCGKQEPGSLSQFLQEVIAGGGADPAKLAGFTMELTHTVLNDTLAQHTRIAEGRLLAGGYDELETAAMDGHPYHPSYKSRIGFSVTDQIEYGPEFDPLLRPVWTAIVRSDAAAAIAEGSSFRALWEEELGPAWLQAIEQKLRSLKLQLDDVVLLPVHPWQWRNVILKQLQEELRMNRIIPLGTAEDLYRPSQSIRTLMPASRPKQASLKLSMTLLNTSSYRHIEPHYTVVAPAISAWLQHIVDRDPYLSAHARVILLHEFAAIGYDPGDNGEADVEGSNIEAGLLSCIWRESLAGKLADGETAAPFHALAAVDPVTGRAFIDPWLQQHGVEHWLRELLRTSVLPVAHLAIAHGIGLESHAQNMAVVLRAGLPVRVALKDFHEDMMFYRPLLQEPQRCPDFGAIHPAFRTGRWFEQENVEPLRYLLLGALYCINLSELALLLAEHYQFGEERFWALAAESLTQHLAVHPELTARAELLNPFAPVTRLEQLTKKRLFQREGSPLMHEVANPLYHARLAKIQAEEQTGGSFIDTTRGVSV